MNITYESLYDKIQKKYSNNEYTFEQANILNDMAYEKYISESVFFNEKDIFYNKAKFENGDINLLCIVGYSGGGKSTLSNEQIKVMREVVDMDKIVLNMSKDDEYFKNLGPFAYQFINGPGKKFRCTDNTNQESLQNMDIFLYRPIISKELFKFAEKYAKAHKSIKLVIEGVWIYRYIDPSEASSYAVYIKGTSLAEATRRALKRDHEVGADGKGKISQTLHKLGKYAMASNDAFSSALTKWQDFYRDRYKKQLNEDEENTTKKISNTGKNIIHDIKNGDIKGDIKSVTHSVKSSFKHAKKKIIKK